MNKRTVVIIIILVVAVLAGVGAWVYFRLNKPPKNVAEIDKFAKCLTEKKVAMYGAYWCPHCKKQKELFGESFQYVNYVECTKDINKCKEKEIKGYPTWIFKDGSRINGEATFEELAEKTSCKVPKA